MIFLKIIKALKNYSKALSKNITHQTIG